jgi:putative membrane protein
MVKPAFSAQDLLRIQQVVESAERRTRGEIVPMVVAASARYRETTHLAGVLALFLTLGASLWLRTDLDHLQWGGINPGWLMLALAVAYVTGVMIGGLPVVIRMLTAEDRMAMKVRLRAEHAFYEKGLHRTRGATGILIFVSLLERRVVILADRAINERVSGGTWEALAQDLVSGIRAGDGVAALCRAITACGAILMQHFPAQDSDNPNELRDELIQDS